MNARFSDAEAAEPTNLPIPRATVEQVESWRNQALELYQQALVAISAASEAMKVADATAQLFGGVNNYSYHHAQELEEFFNSVSLPDPDRFMRTARKLTNIAAWSFIIDKTDLERLMDKEAKEQLRGQMDYVPERGQLITDEENAKSLPEFEAGTVYATLQQFVADSGTIFKRGIANVFSKLDRRFRSHDGFKIGSRIILEYAFDRDSGHLNWGHIRDQLIDIERVFAVLDNRPDSSFRSALYALDNDRRGFRPTQSETETEYFRIKGYKNGNAHLWFTRDDLTEKVNLLLADWYGEVIGDAETQEADPFADKKTTPARYFGFYPTPQPVVDQIFRAHGWNAKPIYVLRDAEKPQLRILEPSAGTGQLARRCITSIKDFSDWSDYGEPEKMERWRHEYRFDNLVDCVELQSTLAHGLESTGLYNRVYCQDFLTLRPEATGLYDIVVMNPPFDRERDIDHVMHALTFLKPGGLLTAIMSSGTEFRETKKAAAFREVVAKMGGHFIDLPPGSFSEVGTNVNTCYVQLTKPGA